MFTVFFIIPTNVDSCFVRDPVCDDFAFCTTCSDWDYFSIRLALYPEVVSGENGIHSLIRRPRLQRVLLISSSLNYFRKPLSLFFDLKIRGFSTNICIEEQYMKSSSISLLSNFLLPTNTSILGR